MKLVTISVILLTFLLPVKSIHAEPKLCKTSAITFQEKEVVNTLTKMYYLQSKIEFEEKKLDQLNHQKSKEYDPYDAKSVDAYNKKVGEYNDIVDKRNELSNQYNQLKDLYNLLVNQISPSTNTLFITCLNSQALGIEINTNSINIDSLNTNTDNLIRNTDNLRRNTDNLIRNTDNIEY